MAKPENRLTQTTQPRQAIAPPKTTQPPSLVDEAPLSQVFLAQEGQQLRFMHQDGQWQASVVERIGEFYRVELLPVVCEGHGDIEKALADLQEKPDKYVQRRIHVLPGQGHPPHGLYR